MYARFLLDRFCAGYDSASQAGGGTEEPIYSQALLLEPRHGLPPPPPQIALRFAAQINLEGQQKIQATALWAGGASLRADFLNLNTAGRGLPALPTRPGTGRWLVSWQLGRCAAKQSGCEILPVVDADQGSGSRCSWIGSRAVISKLEQLLERPGMHPFYRTHSLASSHLQAGVN